MRVSPAESRHRPPRGNVRMSKLTTRIAAAAAETTDAVVALVEAAWPRSMST